MSKMKTIFGGLLFIWIVSDLLKRVETDNSKKIEQLIDYRVKRLVSYLEAELCELKDKCNSLESTVDELESKIDELESTSEIDDLKSTVADLESKIDDIESRADDLECDLIISYK